MIDWSYSQFAQRTMKQVGDLEAKNELGALLDLVEHGEEVLITRRGKAVARLVPAKPTADPERARAVLAAAGIEPDYVAVADLDGATLAIAARVGSTRLIDNVLLEGAA